MRGTAAIDRMRMPLLLFRKTTNKKATPALFARRGLIAFNEIDLSSEDRQCRALLDTAVQRTNADVSLSVSDRRCDIERCGTRTARHGYRRRHRRPSGFTAAKSHHQATGWCCVGKRPTEFEPPTTVDGFNTTDESAAGGAGFTVIVVDFVTPA